MARLAVTLALLGLFVACAYAAADSFTAISARTGFYRQLTVAAQPDLAALGAGTATSVAVAAVGAQGMGTAAAGSVHVDVAGFKFKNPNDPADDNAAGKNRALLFYFGYLGVDGAWNNDSKTAALAGALAEIAVSWDSLFIYYNHDGVAGAQLQLTKDWTNCAAATTGGFDCVDLGGSIPLKNLTWGGISSTKSDCPPGYNVNCTVYKLTTASTDGTITFSMRLASEPIFINGVRVDPNYAKVDVDIAYPWSKMTLIDAANAKVGILAYSAGRAGTVGAVRKVVDNREAVIYEVNDKSAYFSWDATATLSGNNATVYAQGISGANITGANCSNCSLTSGVIVGLLKIAVAVYQGLGWNVDMLVFSWDETKPTNVFWDPVIGTTTPPPPAPTGTNPNTNTADAFAFAPSIAFAIAAAIISLF